MCTEKEELAGRSKKKGNGRRSEAGDGEDTCRLPGRDSLLIRQLRATLEKTAYTLTIRAPSTTFSASFVFVLFEQQRRLLMR